MGDISCILESVLLATNKPLTEKQLLNFFPKNEQPSLGELRDAIYKLREFYQDRSLELIEVASGFRFQIKPQYCVWVNQLWDEKAPKFSRAFLETISIIAYRQPITRAEIESIRGVAISSSIFKTLLDEREWIRVLGHRDVPGRPGLYGTTQKFLDYLGLKRLEQLPALPEIKPLTELGSEESEVNISDNSNEIDASEDVKETEEANNLEHENLELEFDD